MMCLQLRKHTVLPCHLCLLLHSPVLNFPVPYFLSPAVWQTEEVDVHVLVHSVLAAHTCLAGYPHLLFLLSLLIAPRALSWHMGLLGRLMFHGVYKHGLVRVFSGCPCQVLNSVYRTWIQGSLTVDTDIESVTVSQFLQDWVYNFTEHFTCIL